MKQVMIIAGEASGDLHGAKLVKAVKRHDEQVHFFGIGGHNMREAGVDTLVDAADMAVVGLVEIWGQRKVIFGALRQMRELLAKRKPDLLILIDYPEFNMRLAKTAKELGIKVLYYISPQIWAWRQYRVKRIRKLVDMMAVVFPFEVDFYHRHDVPVRFVGHPLVEEVAASAERSVLMDEFGLDAQHPVVGLFPGSRNSELRRLLPIILAAAQQIQHHEPGVQFVLPVASGLKRDIIAEAVAQSGLDVKLIEHRGYDVMAVSDAIITVSGTVTLEISLIGTPMVIINKVAGLTYHIVRRMLKIKHIGLCNIVADRELVPELIQYEATPENISKAVLRMLDDASYHETLRENLGTVEEKLGKPGGIDNIARLTLDMLNSESGSVHA